MIKLDGETLHLRRADNAREFTVQLSQISDADRAYARQQSVSAKKKAKRGKPPSNQANSEDALDNRMAALAKQHGLATANGLPVVMVDDFLPSYDPTNRSLTREKLNTARQMLAAHHARFAKFLELVVLGMDPESIEQVLPTFIANHFPREVAQQYVNSKMQTGGAVGIWKGNDEFERNAAKQNFRDQHAKELAAIAVRLPIRVLFVSKIDFSQYDFSRGGLVVSELSKSGTGFIPGTAWPTAIPRMASLPYGAIRQNAAPRVSQEDVDFLNAANVFPYNEQTRGLISYNDPGLGFLKYRTEPQDSTAGYALSIPQLTMQLQETEVLGANTSERLPGPRVMVLRLYDHRLAGAHFLAAEKVEEDKPALKLDLPK